MPVIFYYDYLRHEINTSPYYLYDLFSKALRMFRFVRGLGGYFERLRYSTISLKKPISIRIIDRQNILH